MGSIVLAKGHPERKASWNGRTVSRDELHARAELCRPYDFNTQLYDGSNQGEPAGALGTQVRPSERIDETGGDDGASPGAADMDCTRTCGSRLITGYAIRPTTTRCTPRPSADACT